MTEGRLSDAEVAREFVTECYAAREVIVVVALIGGFTVSNQLENCRGEQTALDRQTTECRACGRARHLVDLLTGGRRWRRKQGEEADDVGWQDRFDGDMRQVGAGCLTDTQMILLKHRGAFSGKLRDGGMERCVEKLAGPGDVTVACDVGQVRASWSRKQETRDVTRENRRSPWVNETTASEG